MLNEFKELSLEKQVAVIAGIAVVVGMVVGALWKIYTHFSKGNGGGDDSKGNGSGDNTQDNKIIKALLDKDRRIELQEEEIQALRDAFKDLRSREDTPELQEALALLERGDTSGAEGIFQRILEQKIAEGKKADREAAVAARHLGSLAYLHDTEKAIRAYRQATELDPENSEGWNQLGPLLHRIGDLEGAENAFETVRKIAETTDQPACESRGL